MMTLWHMFFFHLVDRNLIVQAFSGFSWAVCGAYLGCALSFFFALNLNGRVQRVHRKNAVSKCFRSCSALGSVSLTQESLIFQLPWWCRWQGASMELLKHFFQNHLLLRRFHFDGMLIYISELHSSISKTCLVSSVVYICNDFKKCHLGWCLEICVWLVWFPLIGMTRPTASFQPSPFPSFHGTST